jgi:hypothetical protein
MSRCCCNFGAAVKGEWPEFQCYYCERHTDPIMADPMDACKRHKGIYIDTSVPKERVRSARQMLEKLAGT